MVIQVISDHGLEGVTGGMELRENMGPNKIYRATPYAISGRLDKVLIKIRSDKRCLYQMPLRVSGRMALMTTV